MKNTSDGGEAVLQAFRCLGIDYVMSSPGSEWGAVWEALARQKIDGRDGPAYLSILGAIPYDENCAFNDCSFSPEPTTNEPDPIPMGDGDGDGDQRNLS